MKWFTFYLAVVGFFACSEASLIQTDVTATLNSPMSMVLIGTDLAVVANANVNLNQKGGSLFAIDLVTQQIATDTLTVIPDFAGRITIDSSINRLYVPVRSKDALLAFDYVVPGSGSKPIELTPVTVPEPKENIDNGVETDDNPFDAIVLPGTSQGDVVAVTNVLSGSVSIIPESTLLPIDYDKLKNDQMGIPLLSASNFDQRAHNPGKGANHMVLSTDGKLLFVGSTLSNDIYVLNAKTLVVEAMFSLNGYVLGKGVRGMAVDSSKRLYVASRGLDGVLALDVSQIAPNGIPYEIVNVPLLGSVLTGRGPEGLIITADEMHLFVSHQLENSVVKLSLPKLTIENRVDVGVSPGELVLDTPRNFVYVLNFLSDDITVLKLSDGSVDGTIQ